MRPQKEANALFWDGAADRWRNLDRPNNDRVMELIGDFACPPGSIILDAGCGSGRWSIPLAQAGYRVRGVDLSPQMVATASGHATEQGLSREVADFQVGDIEHIPYPNDTFDGIVCFNVLDFVPVPSPGAALTEMWRVLKADRRMAPTRLSRGNRGGAFSQPATLLI